MNSSGHSNATTGCDAAALSFVYLSAVMSSLSIIGSCGIVAVYTMCRDSKVFCRKMLVYLSIADFLTALGNLMGVTWYMDVEPKYLGIAYCKLHSALTIYSSCVSFFWTLTIAVHLNLTIIHNQASAIERLRYLFHALCWGLPGVIAAVALGCDVLGYDKSLDQATWCWIDPRVPYAIFWQFFTGKAWELLACVLTIILYARLKIFLFKQNHKSKELFSQRRKKHHIINEANRKLTFVPVVFIVLRFWGTLRFMLGVCAHDYASSSDSAWLAPLQVGMGFTMHPNGIGDSAQGFANFVLYCFFTERVREQLKSTLCPCWRPKRRVHAEQAVDLPCGSSTNTPSNNNNNNNAEQAT